MSSIVTFLSALKGSWRTITLILGVQYLATILANRHGSVLPHEATNTEFLYNWSIRLFLTIFLTFETTTLPGFLLPVYNATLMTALLGWPQDMKMPLEQVVVHFISISGIIAMRLFLGYLFGRGTGFAYPLLFFNDAIHETTCGLSVIILYLIMKMFYSDRGLHHGQFSAPSFLLLWLPNTLRGPIFFWSFSVAAITGIQALSSLLLEKRMSNLRSSRTQTQKTPSQWSRFLNMVTTFLASVAVFASISYIHHIAYRFSHETHSREVVNLPESVLTNFILLSYPRYNDSTLLHSTLESYVHGLGSRFTANVYTTVKPGKHPAFDDAQKKFTATPGLDFFSDPQPARFILSRLDLSGRLPGKQTFDLYSALSWANRHIRDGDTRYFGIMEDDFQWCDDGWEELKAIIYEVALREASDPSNTTFCGIFVATGGSGLLVRPSKIPLLQNAIERHASDLNPDIILQDCLRGSLPECAGCRLAGSRRLLFRHAGATHSTYRGRHYPENRWQCGWRQPFNGKLGVWVP